MIYRHVAREGQGIEQRRQELLAAVAGRRAIAAARVGERSADRRPIAAPGSFLALLRKHLATGRFRPARPATIAPGRAGR